MLMFMLILMYDFTHSALTSKLPSWCDVLNEYHPHENDVEDCDGEQHDALLHHHHCDDVSRGTMMTTLSPMSCVSGWERELLERTSPETRRLLLRMNAADQRAPMHTPSHTRTNTHTHTPLR